MDPALAGALCAFAGYAIGVAGYLFLYRWSRSVLPSLYLKLGGRPMLASNQKEPDPLLNIVVYRSLPELLKLRGGSGSEMLTVAAPVRNDLPGFHDGCINCTQYKSAEAHHWRVMHVENTRDVAVWCENLDAHPEAILIAQGRMQSGDLKGLYMEAPDVDMLGVMWFIQRLSPEAHERLEDAYSLFPNRMGEVYEAVAPADEPTISMPADPDHHLPYPYLPPVALDHEDPQRITVVGELKQFANSPADDWCVNAFWFHSPPVFVMTLKEASGKRVSVDLVRMGYGGMVLSGIIVVSEDAEIAEIRWDPLWDSDGWYIFDDKERVKRGPFGQSDQAIVRGTLREIHQDRSIWSVYGYMFYVNSPNRRQCEELRDVFVEARLSRYASGEWLLVEVTPLLDQSVVSEEDHPNGLRDWSPLVDPVPILPYEENVEPHPLLRVDLVASVEKFAKLHQQQDVSRRQVIALEALLETGSSIANLLNAKGYDGHGHMKTLQEMLTANEQVYEETTIELYHLCSGLDIAIAAFRDHLRTLVPAGERGFTVAS